MTERGALLVVDVQNDFCPGGALPIPEGDKVVPGLNEYIDRFHRLNLSIYLSRDWHPQVTRHFKAYGGVWPPHCVQSSRGAEFHPGLRFPPEARIISKGMDPEEDAYSAFQGSDDQGKPLRRVLQESGVNHLYIGGLATDYCVKCSARDALRLGFKVSVLQDASRGVDLKKGDIEQAIQEMMNAGARLVDRDQVFGELP